MERLQQQAHESTDTIFRRENDLTSWIKTTQLISPKTGNRGSKTNSVELSQEARGNSSSCSDVPAVIYFTLQTYSDTWNPLPIYLSLRHADGLNAEMPCREKKKKEVILLITIKTPWCPTVCRLWQIIPLTIWIGYMFFREGGAMSRRFGWAISNPPEMATSVACLAPL